jgi:RNA polymerase sigma factor (sigma-70 family)
MPNSSKPNEDKAPRGFFPQTRWSVVRSAQIPASDAERLAALNELCTAYRPPLVRFAQSLGNSQEDAEDLTQGFLTQVISRDLFGSTSPLKGRLRSFLLVAFKRFAANEWHKASAAKRNHGKKAFSIDAAPEAMDHAPEPSDDRSPDKVFEKEWALHLLQRVKEALWTDYENANKDHLVAALSPFLLGDSQGTSYADVSKTLDLPEGTVKSHVFRMRQRYKQLLREEISHTVNDPDEIDNELQHLRQALSYPSKRSLGDEG